MNKKFFLYILSAFFSTASVCAFAGGSIPPVSPEVKAAYKEAVDLYRQKKFYPAQDAFEHVDKVVPGYRATRHYLKIIDRDIIMAKEKAMWLAQIEEKKRKRASVQQEQRLRQQELKAEKNEAQDERVAQEKKHREEISRKQERQREEKIKQEEIIGGEDQRRQEGQGQGRQQLEAMREIVRQQLEDGVEAMYQQALSLYNQGDYAVAADGFKYVQDIFPGYKRSKQYMDEARQKSLAVKPQAVTHDASEGSTDVPTTPAVASASASVSRQDNVFKALDSFDPNAR